MDILEAILWLTLNIYHEARGDGEMSQLAVAHVTLNRAEQGNRTVKETVLAPAQFSWTLLEKKRWIPDDTDAFLQCLHSAGVAARGYDFTGGATHYHLVTINPWWADDMLFVGQFGSHRLYKEDKP